MTLAEYDEDDDEGLSTYIETVYLTCEVRKIGSKDTTTLDKLGVTIHHVGDSFIELFADEWDDFVDTNQPLIDTYLEQTGEDIDSVAVDFHLARNKRPDIAFPGKHGAGLREIASLYPTLWLDAEVGMKEDDEVETLRIRPVREAKQ